MVVYPTTMDETTNQTLFRSSREDRWIPLGLALLWGLTVPLWWFFPLGPGSHLAWGASAFGLAAGFLFARRWWRARQTVTWGDDRLVLTRGRRSTTVILAQLTAIDVRPASRWTRLRTPSRTWKISHRLLGTDELLFRLRLVRPDLFSGDPSQLRFRASSVEAGFILTLALASVVAAWRVGPFVPALAVVFVLGALVALVRVLVFLPRRFVVEPGRLRVSFWVGHRDRGRPLAFREDAYAAGGAVFFRMVLDYPRGKVVLDEGHLVDPLRPRAGEVVRLLETPVP